MATEKRWLVYFQTPSGTQAVLSTNDPQEALSVLRQERHLAVATHQARMYGVIEEDNEEKGDVESELESEFG